MVGKPAYLATDPCIVGHCLACCGLLQCCCCSVWSGASLLVLVARLLCSAGSARFPSALHPCSSWSVGCLLLIPSRLLCSWGSARCPSALQFCSAWSVGCPWLLPSSLHCVGGSSLTLHSCSAWSLGCTYWEPKWLEVNDCTIWVMVGKPAYLTTGPGIVGHCLAFCALLHCCRCSAWSRCSPSLISALHPC